MLKIAKSAYPLESSRDGYALLPGTTCWHIMCNKQECTLRVTRVTVVNASSPRVQGRVVCYNAAIHARNSCAAFSNLYDVPTEELWVHAGDALEHLNSLHLPWTVGTELSGPLESEPVLYVTSSGGTIIEGTRQ